MIIPDVNLLIYAYTTKNNFHLEARKWWESTLIQGEAVGIPWFVLFGFWRILTNRLVIEPPLSIAQVSRMSDEWFSFENVRPLEPGPRHYEIFKGLLTKLEIGGNLVSDAHLAALAIEHSCTLYSNDRDFDRFPALRWKNPLGK